MMYSDATFPKFYQRLRRPAVPHTVANSLPVLFFGDLTLAQIATVGINPSDREYLDQSGQELTGSARRFETLASLHADARQSLSDAQCASAIARMQCYFKQKETVYSWFRSLNHVLQAMDYSYASGQVAHLDLIQEATKPTWSALAKVYRDEASSLLTTDLTFLRWQLTTFPLQAVLCNGKTVLRHVCGMLDQAVDVDHIVQGRLARVNLYATRGYIGSRAIILAGWNIPLARPTGLGNDGKQALGLALKTFVAPPA